MKTWLTPIRILVLYLATLAILATFVWEGIAPLFWLSQIARFAILWGSGFAVIQILNQTSFKTPYRWEHLVITSLILFLLFDSLQPWWGFVLVAIVTQLIEKLLRVPTGPLLNPAATGAMIATLMSVYPIWWGTSFAPRIPLFDGGMSVAALLTLPVAGYVTYRYKKYFIPVTAFITFGVLYGLLTQKLPLFALFDGTLFFFLLVMAIEPKTTPVMKNQQIIYGGVLGVLLALALKFYFLEPYAGALLACNLGFNLFRHQSWLKAKFQKPAPPQTINIQNPV